MLSKELDDSGQVLYSTDPEFHSIAVVYDDRTTAVVRLHVPQDPLIPSVLNDPEFGQDLPAQPHSGLTVNADMEATFAIYEPDYPLCIQPFLLITCTHRIVTLRRPASPLQWEMAESAE